MYSYKDRIRAVEFYIKLGKRVKPTIRQLDLSNKANELLKNVHRGVAPSQWQETLGSLH